MVVMQSHRPNQFFTVQQQRRLVHLMNRWRAARDAGRSLSASTQAELNALVDAEVRVSGERAATAPFYFQSLPQLMLAATLENVNAFKIRLG